MKMNQLTITAIAVAAFTTAPLFTPAINSFAATNTAKTTTVETPIHRMGFARLEGLKPIETFDTHGKNRNRPITTSMDDFYIISQVTINGQKFYRLQYETYVHVNDVVINEEIAGESHEVFNRIDGVKTNDYLETPVYDVNGKPTGKTLPAHTTLRSSAVVLSNNETFYKTDRGYLLSRDVDRVVWRDNKAKVGTVQYVPGYGIQVWTKDHAAVHNADGSLKKLAHKTSWKIFDETTINGKAFYNLGGNQWAEADYMSLR